MTDRDFRKEANEVGLIGPDIVSEGIVISMLNEIDGLRAKNQKLSDVVNDLMLTVGMYIEGYPFDEHHKIKQKELNDYACRLIGKPTTINELKLLIQKSEED